MALSALMLASCANEDLNGPAQDGPVVFSVQLPGEFTRAISDGSTATQLSYAVYLKGEDNVLFTSENTGDPQAAAFSGLKTSLSLNLAKGKEYDIIFWADKPGNSFYDFKPAAKSVEIKYDGIVSNDEDRDAFFQKETFKVTGAETRTVTLRRPFAQLNFATSDLEAANKAGLNFSKTQVTVSNVYNTLNLLTGVASNTATGDNAVTFAWNGLVNNDVVNGTTDTSKKYNWLSMNYLLTGAVPGTDIQTADSETVNCTFKVQDSNASKINSIDISNVPVQRNYRTNIYGALLTSTVDFNIQIVPGYYDENDVEYGIQVSSQADLNNALQSGVSNIHLAEGEYTFEYPATASSDLKISGAGKDLTIININKSFYPEGKNISFDNLTYKVPTGLSYNESDFGFIQRVGDVNFYNCKIDGSLRLNLNNGDVATIDKCEFVVSTKNGFDGYPLFYYAGDGSKVVVSNSTFTSVSKGIVMYNESAKAYDLTVNNCTFNASETDNKCAIQMHTEYGISGTLRINNSTATGFMNKNDGLWNDVNNLTNSATKRFDVYVDGNQVQKAELDNNGARINGTVFYSLNAAIAAADGQPIELEAGSYSLNINNAKDPWRTAQAIKLIGAGADKTQLTNVDFEELSNADLDFSNLTITPTQNPYNHTACGFKNIKSAKYNNVTFNGEYHAYATDSEEFTNCKFQYNQNTDPLNKGRYNMYYETPVNMTLTGCTFTNVLDRGLLLYTTNTNDIHDRNLTVTDCTFNADATQDGKERGAIEIHSENFGTVGGTVTIKNTTCNDKFVKGICNEINADPKLFTVTINN